MGGNILKDYDMAGGGTTTSPTQVGRLTNVKLIGLQITGASLNAADASFQVQHSIDGVNFDDISGATGTIAQNGSDVIAITNFVGEFLQVVITEGNVTSGTLNIWMSCKI